MQQLPKYNNNNANNNIVNNNNKLQYPTNTTPIIIQK
jgi:hypothetical protein